MKSNYLFFGCLLLFLTKCYCLSYISITPSNLTVFAGENAEFECNVSELSSDSSVFWSWFRDDYNLVATEHLWMKDLYTMTVTNGRKTSTLTLSNTTLEDNGSTYVCYFDILFVRAKLTVITNSIYPKCDGDTSRVNTDRKLYLICSANGGDPIPKLQWYKNGNMLNEEIDFYDGQVSYFDEVMYNLRKEDEGAIFICKAEGLAVNANQSCQVQINVPPSVVVSSNATTFLAGDSIEFYCSVMTPWNVTDYIWTISSEITNTNFKNTLIISNLQSTDSGTEIKCTVITLTELSGSDSLIITYVENSGSFKIYIIVAVIIIVVFISIVLFVIVKLRQKKIDTSRTSDTIMNDIYESRA